MTSPPAPPFTPPPAPPFTPLDTENTRGPTPATGPRTRHPWRIVGWALAGILLAALVVAAAALTETSSSSEPLAPNNPGRFGSQAVARVLESQGVTVRPETSPRAALGTARAGDTLFIADDGSLLNSRQIDALATTAADVVLVAPRAALLEAMTDGHVSVGQLSSTTVARSPNCSDPDARAAGRITTQLVFETDGDDAVTMCFPEDEAAGGAGRYVVYTTPTRTVRVVSSPYVFTNEDVSEEGNAALVLRALGHNERLVWLLPDGEDDSSVPSLMPDAFWPTMWLLVAAVVAIALWRGRRLGKLVTEPLPVIVRASETVRGRGRLYRAGRARGHAAAGLRANAADRMAIRLGLPRSTPPHALVAAIARATGRPDVEISDALYGPAPSDDAGLGTLAHTLDQIESEVYHS